MGPSPECWGDAMRRIMHDKKIMAKYPNGIDASEMYAELVECGSNVATAATVLDVANFFPEICS